MDPIVTEKPYPEADKVLHIPGCGQTVIRDFNDMPNRMWGYATQTWRCEGCGTTMQRHMRGGKWSAWEPAGWPCGSLKPHEAHTWAYLHVDDQRRCHGIPPD